MMATLVFNELMGQVKCVEDSLSYNTKAKDLIINIFFLIRDYPQILLLILSTFKRID